MVKFAFIKDMYSCYFRHNRCDNRACMGKTFGLHATCAFTETCHSVTENSNYTHTSELFTTIVERSSSFELNMQIEPAIITPTNAYFFNYCSLFKCMALSKNMHTVKKRGFVVSFVKHICNTYIYTKLGTN